jgi:hypothetical protein
MFALIVGTLLALAALAYVLWPIITAAEARPSATSQGAARAQPSDQSTPEPEITSASEASLEDAAEAEIRRARAQLKMCPVCGPRPEAEARYCSRCGRPLA